MWQLVRHTYGTEFAKFLDRQIASTDEHGRGSMQRQWRALIEANAGAAKVPDGPAQRAGEGAA